MRCRYRTRQEGVADMDVREAELTLHDRLNLPQKGSSGHPEGRGCTVAARSIAWMTGCISSVNNCLRELGQVVGQHRLSIGNPRAQKWAHLSPNHLPFVDERTARAPVVYDSKVCQLETLCHEAGTPTTQAVLIARRKE
ncbi:hypothetical protein F5H01DRAFT_372101 [Linnemannia elongata]|nr:hypothetical protein F5H01DRAFT_372101 [Linnemannia elongata]